MLHFKIWLEHLTTEQNQGMKKFYLLVRNILLDIRNQMTQHSFEKFDDPKDFIIFWRDFRKVYKLSQNVKGWSGAKLEVVLPEEIRRIFPNIIEPFYISFPFEENEIGGMVVYDGPWAGENKGKTDELRISLKHLLDFEKYKGTLQHELQHLVDIGSDIDHTINNVLLKTIKYQCNLGEIAAFAKEFAYRYYKMFTKDEKLDFDKFKINFFKKGFSTLDNFINFGEDSERLKKQYNISDNEYDQMIQCYEKFRSELENSFFYYKRRII